MQDKLDRAREVVLDRIIGWATEQPRSSEMPGHVRNLATVYDILNNVAPPTPELQVGGYVTIEGKPRLITSLSGQATDHRSITFKQD